MIDSLSFPGVFATPPDPLPFCAAARAAAAAAARRAHPAGPHACAAPSGGRPASVVITSPENGRAVGPASVTAAFRVAGFRLPADGAAVLRLSGPRGRGDALAVTGWPTRRVGRGGRVEVEVGVGARLEPAGLWRLRVTLVGRDRRPAAEDLVLFFVVPEPAG